MKTHTWLILIPSLLVSALSATGAEGSDAFANPGAADHSKGGPNKTGGSEVSSKSLSEIGEPGSLPKDVQDILAGDIPFDERFKRIASYLFDVQRKQGQVQAAADQARIAQALINKYPEAKSKYRWSSAYEMLLEAARNSEPATSRSLVQRLLQYPIPKETKWRAEAHLILLDQLGKPLSYQFTAIDGTEVDTRQLLGNVILVYFVWGNTPDDYVRMSRVYKSRHDQGFQILTMCAEENVGVLQRTAKENGIEWPLCDGVTSRKLQRNCKGVTWWPTYLLIDRQGNLADYHASNDLDAKVVKLLNEP